MNGPRIRSPARPDSDTVWFYVKRCNRRQRCGITVTALMVLDAEKAGRGYSLGAPKMILQQRKAWVHMLALLELAEHVASKGPLVLTEARVRFQLACDDTPDLPDVLCI